MANITNIYQSDKEYEQDWQQRFAANNVTDKRIQMESALMVHDRAARKEAMPKKWKPFRKLATIAFAGAALFYGGAQLTETPKKVPEPAPSEQPRHKSEPVEEIPVANRHD